MCGWDAKPSASPWVPAQVPVGPVGLCWGRLCPPLRGLPSRGRPPVISWGGHGCGGGCAALLHSKVLRSGLQLHHVRQPLPPAAPLRWEPREQQLPLSQCHGLSEPLRAMAMCHPAAEGWSLKSPAGAKTGSSSPARSRTSWHFSSCQALLGWHQHQRVPTGSRGSAWCHDRHTLCHGSSSVLPGSHRKSG